LNPPSTVLVNEDGEHVADNMWGWGCSNNGDACETDMDCEPGAYCGCSCRLVQLGDDAIIVPEDQSVNSDCMAFTAEVTWPVGPYMTSECGYAIPVTCSYSHDPLGDEPEMSQDYLATLVEHGGVFAQGRTTFTCWAEGMYCTQCPWRVEDSWTVVVSDKNAMNVIVQLAPEMKPGAGFTHCVKFELFYDCFHPPLVVCKDLFFGPPFAFPGKAIDELKVPKQQYMCITAKDCFHSLRAVDMPIECVDNALVAEFHGDPALGGNWLITGNLDCNDHIDIVDFAIFLSQYSTYVGKDSPCDFEEDPCCDLSVETGHKHADLDGDGGVWSSDFYILARNFLEETKDACCDDPTAGRGMPTLSISVKELRRRGMGDLTVADLNGDGVVDQDDMVEFMQGNVPVRPERIKRTGVRSSLD
jgi:hypothetical protein